MLSFCWTLAVTGLRPIAFIMPPFMLLSLCYCRGVSSTRSTLP